MPRIELTDKERNEKRYDNEVTFIDVCKRCFTSVDEDFEGAEDFIHEVEYDCDRCGVRLTVRNY